MNAAKRSALRGGWGAPVMALLVLCVAGMARAQDVEPVIPKKWAVKVGTFLPANGNLVNQSSDEWWYVGVDYHPNLRFRPLNGELYGGADFAFRDSGGKTFLSASLAAKIIWSITPPESRVHLYGGAGLGVYIINTANIGATTQPGGKFILGLDLTKRFFLEAVYDWVGGFTDDLGIGLRTDGITVAAGYRF